MATTELRDSDAKESATCTAENEARPTTLPPKSAAGSLASGDAVLVDVRTPAEFRELHATGAINFPLDNLIPADVTAQHASEGQTVYLICKSGSRSAMALKKFSDAGIDTAASIDGGTIAWENAGLSVARGQKTVSLERQVRIAAGTLVLIGVGIGFLHPAGFAVSAFVGAGLVFAGVTDTCGMGMLLSKMPWNR